MKILIHSNITNDFKIYQYATYISKHGIEIWRFYFPIAENQFK